MTRIALALLVAAAACGDRNDTAGVAGPTGDPATGKGTGPGGATTARRAGPTDVPPQFDCVADADCTVAVTVPGADPCCEMTATAMPVNAKWLSVMATWREGHCAGVKCPSLELPGARLPPCGYDARCVDKKCDNACNVIPPADALTDLPADAPKRLACREDSDCMIVGSAPSPVNACCDGSARPVPISREFFVFVAMWRTGSCKHLQCPPKDTAPSESLARCAREPRCVKRSCTDACSAPPRRRAK